MPRINIELDILKIEKAGKLRRNENFDFRAFLKGQDPDKIDRIVHRLNREISSRIDCTNCGNCCDKLQPYIKDRDISKLSEKLNMTPDQIEDKYIESDQFDKHFKNLPCSFLKNKKCTIYNDRPEDCHSYPHLHKKGFTSRLLGVIENYSICPIVFNVYEHLKEELLFRK